MSDDDWSDDDTPSLLPPPPAPLPPAPISSSTPALTQPSLLLFMPILLTSTNYIEPLNAGLAILQDKINRTIVMYDQNKQTVFMQIIAQTAGINMQLMEDKVSVQLIDEKRTPAMWKITCRNRMEAFRLIALFCVSMGLSAPQSGIQNISYDLLRADKKSKQCRADHFAEVRIKIWSFSSSSLAELVPSFDPDDFTIDFTSEVKISADGKEDSIIVPGSIAEILATMKCGARKLIVASSNLAWIEEIEGDSNLMSQPYFLAFIELVSVSKKSKKKKKKGKITENEVESNDLIETNLIETKESAIVHFDSDNLNTTVNDNVKKIDSKELVVVDPDALATKLSLDYNFVADKLQSVCLDRDDSEILDNLKQCILNGNSNSEVVFALYKQNVSGLYDSLRKVLLKLNPTDELPEVNPEKLEISLDESFRSIRILIRESVSAFKDSIENIEEDIIGSPNNVKSAMQLLTDSVQSFLSKHRIDQDIVRALVAAESEIKVLHSKLDEFQKELVSERSRRQSIELNSISSDSSKKLTDEVERLKSALIKEQNSHRLAVNNFNELQMKLATSNVELDEELRVLRKEKKILEDQVTSLQAFEMGVVEMRNILDDTTSAKNEAIEDLNRLCSLQSKYSLTWIPEGSVKKCMACKFKFKFFGGRSKKHCHYCGRVFCDQCCSQKLPLPEYGFKEEVRLCESCYDFKTNEDE